MKDINKILVKEGLSKDLCKPWALRMEKASIDELLQMYVEGVDFCLDNNFPPNEFLKENAGKKLMDYGIMIDEIIKTPNPKWMVMLGRSRCKTDIDSFTVSEIFLKHQSTANLNIKDNAIVTIDCFDDSILVVTSNDSSKVLINVYGNAKVKTFANGGEIKIVKKLRATYK